MSGRDEIIQGALDSFTCARDSDIEIFARERMIFFESLAKSRTYLFVDDSALKRRALEIIASFSIAPQVLELPTSLSNRKLLALDGFSGKIRHKRISSLPVILISQLAKNDACAGKISGDLILRHAISIAEKVHAMIGGRIITVDVKTGAAGLIHFYERNGFHTISQDTDTGLTQMIYMMCDKIKT